MLQVLEIFSCGRQTCWTDLTYPVPRLLISYQCKESELSVFRRENMMGHAVWPCTLTPNLLKCHAWQYCGTWLSHNCMINWYRSAADTMAYIWMALDHQQTLLYWQNTGQEHMILLFMITFWIFFFIISLFLKFVFIMILIIYLLSSQTTTALHKQFIMYIRSSVIYNMIFLCF